MLNQEAFFNKLYSAVNTKIQWYDTTRLNDLLIEYRNFHSLIQNMYNMLAKKGLIQEDPYKKDKNVTDIFVPDEMPFIEADKASIMGKRISDYETSLDYLCNYFKFSILTLSIDRIQLLLKLNNFIRWQALQTTSAHPNTLALAQYFSSIKNGTDQMSKKVLSDLITVAGKTILKINGLLKELLEFQKEVYKCTVRKSIESNPHFSQKQASESPEAALAQIKKLFSSAMGKTPYYKELIEEIIKENFSKNTEAVEKKLMSKMAVTIKKNTKKAQKVNTKEMLMDAIRSLASIAPQLEQVTKKITENQTILENENKSFWYKLNALLRSAFSIEQPHIEYKVLVEDPLTHLKKQKTLNCTSFIHSLIQRHAEYSSFAIKNTPAYMKIESQEDEQILSFINAQLILCKQMLQILEALNDFFKNAVRPLNREKISNWSMELTSMQNTLVKTAQRKAEYTSYTEEQKQMKKLGILDE